MPERSFERTAAITGLGQSAVGRRLGRSALDLTIDACAAAIADAGLRNSDIDGLSTYPGGDPIASYGYGGPSTYELQDALRLNVEWYQGAAELPGQLGALVSACMAIAAGMARHVLVYRTVTESSAQGSAGRGSVLGTEAQAASGMGSWMAPFGGISAVNWLAPVATRHFHEYGTTREQLGQIPLVFRRNAGLNPKAIFRSPLTMDEYLRARMISSPLCLFDCDIPVDGSTALIVSRADEAKDRRHGGVFFDAIGTALRGRPSWDQYEDMASMASQGAADQLWKRSSLTPRDVDLAQLYDGFSILALVWLESLGFCGEGEAGPYLEGGERISLSGELPLNTAGGQLSAGRLHGFGLIHEAVTQLRRKAGERQVADAEVALVANGGGPIAGVMILTRDCP
ncbi:thiolase family protein [Rhodococcus koreensis]|uniref:thiolase family protein n=1 Tax=Rhodococcus koreensis TaxID=99653 RepID=UPI00366F4F78